MRILQSIVHVNNKHFVKDNSAIIHRDISNNCLFNLWKALAVVSQRCSEVKLNTQPEPVYTWSSQQLQNTELHEWNSNISSIIPDKRGIVVV